MNSEMVNKNESAPIDDSFSLTEILVEHPDFISEFIVAYREKYSRKEMPSETERLARISQLTNEAFKEKINDVLTPSRAKSFKGLIGDVAQDYRESDYDGAYIDAIAKFIKGLTREERYTLDLVTATEVDRLTHEESDAIPLIIEEVSYRKHHGDHGMYEKSFDHTGQAYFSSPDHFIAGEMLKIYGDYFNLPRYTKVKSYALNNRGKVEQREMLRMRMLVESSKYIAKEKMSSEDCDLVDPLPVHDPIKSCASAMVFNLLTGCKDDCISHTEGSQKNHIKRADGTYYLLDISRVGAGIDSESDITKVPSQIKNLESLLQAVDEDQINMLVGYIVQTVVMSASVPQEKLLEIEAKGNQLTSPHEQQHYEQIAAQAIAFPQVFSVWVDKFMNDESLKYKLQQALRTTLRAGMD